MNNQKKTLVHQFTQYQVEKGTMKQDEQELYQYGYRLLGMQAINLFLLILIGIVFQCLGYLLLFMAVYIPLRSVAGGYHADTPGKCMCISVGMECIMAALLYIPEPQMNHWVVHVLMLLAVLFILCRAPVEAKHKPLGMKERPRCRRWTFYNLSVGMLIWGLAMISQMWKIGFVIAVCYIMIAFFMLINTNFSSINAKISKTSTK